MQQWLLCIDDFLPFTASLIYIPFHSFPTSSGDDAPAATEAAAEAAAAAAANDAAMAPAPSVSHEFGALNTLLLVLVLGTWDWGGREGGGREAGGSASYHLMTLLQASASSRPTSSRHSSFTTCPSTCLLLSLPASLPMSYPSPSVLP